MSELCIREFEDVSWDELYQSDHIVPDPSSKRPDDHFILGNNHKTHHVDRGIFLTLRKRNNTMMEKNSWPQAPTAVYSSLSDTDSIKETPSLASDNSRPSNHGFKSNNTDSNDSGVCVSDAIVNEKSTADNNCFSYPLADATHSGSNLNLVENSENKDSSDFLYYGWPEIGNFEDIDRMFRSCDSTFGLGPSGEDELGWLSSADNTRGFGDVLKSDKSPCPEPNVVKNISERHDHSVDHSVNGSATTSAATMFYNSCWSSEKSDSYMSSAIREPIADSKEGFILKEEGVEYNCKLQPTIPTGSHSKRGSAAMINDHKKHFKLQNQSEGKARENYLGDGNFNHISDLPNEVVQLPTVDLSHQALASAHMQQQHTPGPDSYCCQQNPISYVHSDNSHLSDPASVNPGPFTIGAEPNDVISELGSSNVQSSSTVGSGLDDISLEAAGFRQLQLVMEQLDLTTKLCIRDSLYRLARSAELRHNHANLKGSCGDEADASGVAEGTDRCTGFMDIEKDTNPIDRSVAHLLFHRPLDPSTSSAHDSLFSSDKVH